MKKFSSFHVVSLCTLMFLCSCNNSDEFSGEYELPMPTKSQDSEITSLITSIDSLNKTFSIEYDKENAMTEGHRSVVLIRKGDKKKKDKNTESNRNDSLLIVWGGKFFSASVDACVGAVAGAAGGIPGIVFGTLASWTFDKNWEKVTQGPNVMKRVSAVTNTNNIPYVVLNNSNNLNLSDSIGYYHNLLMSKLKESGKTYILNDNTIDYDEIYNDIVQLSRIYIPGANTFFDSSGTKQKIFLNITKDFVEKAKEEGASITDAFASIKDSDLYQIGVERIGINQVNLVYDKMAQVTPGLTDEEFCSYSIELHKIIEKSALPDSTKVQLNTLNGIIVNSTLLRNGQ